MIIAEECFTNCINSPIRRVKGRVELYNGSTLERIFKGTDALQSFTIDRVANEKKAFGYGICQKATVNLVDRERSINITKSHSLECVFGTGCDFIYTNPLFFVEEVKRDENTNTLTITAYDAIYKASKHTVADLNLDAPYTLETFIRACGTFLGLPVVFDGVNDNSGAAIYPIGANLEGTETIRAALDAAAEATQTIYFVNHNWELVFKRLDTFGASVYSITKDSYFTLENKEPFVITGICSATELGDNVSTGAEPLYYVRNNPFWELREDIGAVVDNALTAVNGLKIGQFTCSWRGNYLLEIGDKINITAKDNSIITSYVLSDSITYNGALRQETSWNYGNSNEQTASNPATLGDALKQTFAKVDKVNKQIELVVSDVNSSKETLAGLVVDTAGISATVSNLELTTNNAIDAVNEEIETLNQTVSATMTAEQIKFEIQSELENGTTKVITNTGFTFDDTGLTVSKSGSEMTTQITEDGMKVYRDNTAVLTADNVGVDAINLSASTYLIIGTNSRFENYNSNRTGCFWIGG